MLARGEHMVGGICSSITDKCEEGYVGE